jgi:ribosomal protein S24E
LETISKKESKILKRVELQVLIPEKSGSLTRAEAIKTVAKEMNVDEGSVGLVSLKPQAGTSKLVGKFHVYSDKQVMNRVHEKHLGVRLRTKTEREALKQAKKKAAKPQAK